ncbi:Ras-related protein Rab-4B [Durusdinium trenchii]|uniref:Ras-related protein Rab-4B n=1 Tax=Durusdinium trenchii TaxID=1381693 RepID=A0ABP0SM54_9DINO
MESEKDKYDYLFKFIIIGDAGAGKSCLLHQFIDNKFKKGSSHTIGVEFGSKVITVGGRNIKLQIWDTAGQERYRSVTRSYYRGAAGALIVYDITNRDSYNHLVNWLADARTLARADISIITVGNKVDLKEKREVTFLEASRCAQENDILFLETSALTGEGVEDVFIKVARMILNKIEDGPLLSRKSPSRGADLFRDELIFHIAGTESLHVAGEVCSVAGPALTARPHRSDAEDEDAPLVPPPKLQIGKRGGQVKVTSDHSGLLVTGHGVALANCVVEQDCAYWEIRVLEPGTSSRAFCGVALELNGQRLESTIGDTQTSWAIGGDLPGGPLEKDDIIGVAFGQGAIPNLRFFRNGKEIPGTEVLRIRGEAYPAVSVCDGAELLLVFDSPSFAQDPPGRHTAIVPPRKML